MNDYQASEQAYKNGNELGTRVKQDKYSEQFIKGFNEAINTNVDYADTFIENGIKVFLVIISGLLLITLPIWIIPYLIYRKVKK